MRRTDAVLCCVAGLALVLSPGACGSSGSGGASGGSSGSDAASDAISGGDASSSSSSSSSGGGGDSGHPGDGGTGCLAPGDPSFYATPAVVGSSVRIIIVSPTSTPSLSAAFANARPGDTIVLAGGTYKQSAGNLVLSKSGTALNWITVKAASGATPTIDLAGAGEFTLGASYTLLEGVEIINGGGNNLHVAPAGHSVDHVIVRGCKIHSLSTGPGAAIKINSDNTGPWSTSYVYVEGNDLSQSIGNAVLDAVAVEHAVARGNYIHDNDQGDHGMFFKGGSAEILIENNLIRGIHGNAALQLGGVTGATFFDPNHPSVEGYDQLARNNLITDCDDAVVQIEGCQNAHVHHNTAVTQTGFAIFRLNQGSSSTGAASNDTSVDVTNNLVIATGAPPPQYARDDATSTGVMFSRQLWGGGFVNSGSPGPGVPMFPQTGDVVVAASAIGTVVVNPSPMGVTGLSDALAKFALAAGSPAKHAGVADPLVPCDITGAPRSPTAPSLGAFE
jgi:hypothetical protein